MRIFDIWNRNYYNEDQVLFKGHRLTLYPNKTYCLVGCNGIGKSTILRQMVQDHDSSLDNTAWDMCQNYQFGDLRGVFSEKKPEDYNEFYFKANRKTSIGKNLDDLDIRNMWKNFQSTGEGLSSNYTTIFQALVDSFKGLKGKTYYILLDDFDVGTSIDVLKDFVRVVKKVEELCIKNNITYYMVITANAYELAKNFTCIDCITMEEVKFNSYEEYSDYVIETRKYKDIRNANKKKSTKKSSL